MNRCKMVEYLHMKRKNRIEVKQSELELIMDQNGLFHKKNH